VSMPVPLRGDFDAADLRRLGRSSKDANQARRLLALATIYAGGTRSHGGADVRRRDQSCAWRRAAGIFPRIRRHSPRSVGGKV